MSTGLECDIVERDENEWYYVLQDWDCPAQTWDWHEYATAYGPFASKDDALRHLNENHANPGGYSVYHTGHIHPDNRDEVLEGLFEEAINPYDVRRAGVWSWY